MPEVWIPALLQELTAGRERVEVPGATVREVIDHLEEVYPGIKARLLESDRLRPNITVAVDGEISRLKLRHRLEENSEVHFLHALSGG